MNPTPKLAELRAEIEARANAATPGPWVAGAASYQVIHKDGRLVCEMTTPTSHERDNDAAFIAAARTDVPRLVAALRRAVEALQAPVLVVDARDGALEDITAILAKP